MHPYLAKGHDIMFDVGSSYRFRLLCVISYHYSYCGVELSNALDQILKFIIAKKCFCGNGDQRAYIVFCGKDNIKT